MENSDFVVTLPSNSNILTHPTNRGHNYEVKLAMPINLTSHTLNDDARWEVALTTLQYTNQFYQLREDVTIYAVVIVPDLKSINIKAPSMMTTQLDVNFTTDMRAVAAMGPTVQRILRQFVKDDTNKDEPWFVVISAFVVPAGEYKTPMELARRVVKGFNTLFNTPRYQYRMQVERVGRNGELRFFAESKLETPRARRTSEATSPQSKSTLLDKLRESLADYVKESRAGKYTFLLYTEHISISAPLGQELIVIDDEETPVFYIAPISTNTPIFNTVHSLYVYSDIVDHQRVGNASAQLMDIAPVQGSPGQRAHYVFDPPTYLPVSRSFIETIRIIIHDGKEGEVLFPDDAQNVVCRLHFRRAGVRI